MKKIASIFFAFTIASLALIKFAFAEETYSIIDLGGFSDVYDTYASNINEGGQVVGDYMDSSWLYHGFIWDAVNGFQDMGLGLPLNINENGQIVGAKSYSDGLHAVLWDNGTLVDLGMFEGNPSYALHINDKGEIVGYGGINSPGSTSRVPFIWENGIMTNLNDLIPADSGWTLYSAGGINDHGQIVGYGLHDGVVRGFLLEPKVIPEPATLSLLGLGLLGLVLRKRSFNG